MAGSLLLRAGVGPVARPPLRQRLAALPLDGLPLARPVAVRWNARAVPFIEADTDDDLPLVLGAVHRHLRASQLEIYRRLAQGRAASMVGALALPLDRAIRSLGLLDAVPAIIEALPPATRDWAERFVAGLNHQAEHAPPPPELVLLGIARPEPWTLADFYALARLYSADLTWPVMRRLLRLRSENGPTQWRRRWRVLSRIGLGVVAGDAPLDRAIRAGSNAAALDGARTANNGALLGGDPHLGLALPNAWLIAGLRSPSVEAIGLMLPGMPFIACGRNRRIAWGGTALHAASSDLVDVADVSPARVEPVAIPVRGVFHRRRTVALARRITPHGPVVSDGPLFPSPPNAPLALRWIGARPSDELSAMLGVLRARDWDGFRAALDGFAVPGQCMVYAGPDGVGRVVAAHLPRRPAAPPDDLVRPADAAGRDWTAVLTGRDMFSEWRPAGGAVASANERLAPSEPDGVPIGLFFAPDGRVSRLRTLLAPGPGDPFDLDRFAAVFNDERQPNALALRDLLRDAVPRAVPPRRRAVVAALGAWAGEYGSGSAGALAFELLLAGTARAAIPPGELRAFDTVWGTRALVAAALRDLSAPTLRRAVAAALPDASRRFRRWRVWGRVHHHRPQHPLGALPLLGRRFREPGFPGAGGNDTLNKTGHGLLRRRHVIRFGGTARYAFDIADPDGNLLVLFGGQDGWFRSANWADQLALWRAGGAMRLPLTAAAVARGFPHLTVFRTAAAPAPPP